MVALQRHRRAVPWHPNFPMNRLFAPPAPVAVPVVGQSRTFPVHREHGVDRNDQAQARFVAACRPAESPAWIG